MITTTRTQELVEQTPVLEGFEHIARNWDRSHDSISARILPGEYYVTKSEEIIATVLGSCVSACIRDTHAGIGGMNHFMLPATSGDGSWAGTEVNAATRYGNFAMEHLINTLVEQGAARNGLEIKLFGGGRVLNAMTDVGKKNIDFVVDYLNTEGYRITSSDLGGEVSRKVIYFPRTGRVLVRHLQRRQVEEVVQQETRYLGTLKKEELGGDIDLF